MPGGKETSPLFPENCLSVGRLAIFGNHPTTSNPTFNHTEQPPTSLITMVIIYIIEFIDKNINPQRKQNSYKLLY